MTTSSAPQDVRCSADLDELICPGCCERAVELPSGVGRRAGFAHRDGSALCGTRTGQVVEPIEVPR